MTTALAVAVALPLALGALSGAAAPEPRSADGWYALGRRELAAGRAAQAARAFSRADALNPSAANARALGDALVAAGDFAGATGAYDAAVRRYDARGDTVTALALRRLAAPYRQELALFALLPPPPGDTPAAPEGCRARPGKFEPARGVLTGVFVTSARQRAGGDLDLAPLAVNDFAVFFRYWTLRRPGAGEAFPTAFAAAVRRAGGALHLAVEPGLPLAEIDDAVLAPFARGAREAGVPIFVRFAAEFNDPQNAWSRDPALYRATFRRVAAFLRREAPNVAMVWMPMASRLEVVDAYYPGADAVDWVGVSLYAVPYPNGVTAGGPAAASPLDALRPFYDRYACAHPFQVSEFAASHRSGARPDEDFAAWSAARLRELYWGAALTLPRLKNVNWLDLNGIGNDLVRDKPDVRRNDYRLLDVPEKLAAYREATRDAVFLKAWGARPAEVPLPFPERVRANTDRRGAVWLRTARPAARVEVRLDGSPVASEATLPFRFTLPGGRLAAGPHTLEVRAVDAAGKVLVGVKRAFRAEP